MLISTRTTTVYTNEVVLTDLVVWHLEAGGRMVRATRRVGRARDWLDFSSLGDSACALGKGLQWGFYFIFSLLSLVQGNNYQGPGFRSVFRLETSLWNPCQRFPSIQLNSEATAWGRWSRDESLCIVLILISRTVHVARESLFLLMRAFSSTALLSRSSLTSCNPCFLYLQGAGCTSAAQTLHGETQTPFRFGGGSAGMVCTSPMQSQYVCLWLVYIPSLGMLLCLALCLSSSWSHTWMSEGVLSESLECDDAI